MRIISIVFCVAVLAALWTLVSSYDYTDELSTVDLYCEMVELHQASNGENGWPDYDQSYDEWCR